MCDTNKCDASEALVVPKTTVEKLHDTRLRLVEKIRQIDHAITLLEKHPEFEDLLKVVRGIY